MVSGRFLIFHCQTKDADIAVLGATNIRLEPDILIQGHQLRLKYFDLLYGQARGQNRFQKPVR
jgi:hypothetical protein